MNSSPQNRYRGRLAPSPTGYLHLGHARTFWMASERARLAGGELIFRNDDLDHARCRPEFVQAAREDLAWLGLRWSEGPDVGGPHTPYDQMARLPLYRAALEILHAQGAIFPCGHSRRDVLEATSAPHENGIDDEPIYPLSFRPPKDAIIPPLEVRINTNWRFRVPTGEAIEFSDARSGRHRAIVGQNFGDFLVWRKDDTPSYQLACTVDDASMEISEVVRGEDLILSTFRQFLLYRALGLKAPRFYHCPLLTDDQGIRLAKRHDALSLRALRTQGHSAVSIVARFREASE